MKRRHHLNHVFGRVFSGHAPTGSVLCSIGDDDDGGGGGGDGGGALSPSQITQVNTIIHQAMTKRFESTSFKESLGSIAAEAASSAIESATGSIVDQVKQAVGGSGGEGDSGGDDKTDWTQSAEYQEMLRRDKARDEEIQRIKDEREREIEDRKRSEERELLTAELRKQGVEEGRLRAAVALLLNEDRVIVRADDDAIAWRMQRDGYHDDLAVAAGVAEYLQTDEGKSLLPAKGSRGTGGTEVDQRQKNRNPAEKPSKKEAAATLNAWLAGGSG